MNPTPPTQDALPLGYAGEDDPPPLPPFAAGRGTSEAAAVAIKESAASLRVRVLRWFAGFGPATDQAMMEATGLSHKTGVPRRWELVKRGWIADTGARARISTGRMAMVWEVTEAGKAALADIDAAGRAVR